MASADCRHRHGRNCDRRNVLPTPQACSGCADYAPVEPAPPVEAVEVLGEETRRCVECGVVKPITEFSKNLARGNVGGRQLFCRECGKQHRVTAVRRHHAAKKAAAAPPSPPEPRKTCTRCDQSKPASDFAPYEGTIDHRDFLCSSCREKATAEKEQRAAKRGSAGKRSSRATTSARASARAAAARTSGSIA